MSVDSDATTAPDAGPARSIERGTAALETAGIFWCRVRERAAGSEDDLLVADPDVHRARVVLAGAGFVELRRPGRGSHRAFHAFDLERDAWAKLDLVTAIDHGPYQELPTTLAAPLLARRIGRGTGWALHPDDAFWVVLLHELLDRPTPAIRRPDELRRLAAEAGDGGPARDLVEAVLAPAIPADRVRSLVQAGHWSSVLGLAPALRAGLRHRSPLGVAVRCAGRRLVRAVDRASPPFVRRGVSVALLGPDGVGKSSLGGLVGRAGPLAVRRVYLGLYGDRRTRARLRVPGIGFLRRLVRMWRGWLNGWLHVRRGRFVVYDRYPIDALIARGGGVRTRLARALLGRALPAPDLVVVLDAPADDLYARKPEHPVERLEEQRRGYLRYAARTPGVAVVDASRPAEVVAREVTALAWERRATLDRSR